MKMFQRETITRNDGRPYMVRFVLFSCRWFGLYLHKFHGADDWCMHDHPWGFVSLILAGGYQETTPEETRWFGPGTILWRPPEAIHRVETGLRPAVSLVLHGPWRRPWGFVTPRGWINSKSYSFARHCQEQS